jgi:hypothetical protein
MASSFKDLVGKRVTRPEKFMGAEVVIKKLSVAEVLAIQEAAKEIEKDESKGFDVLRQVIRSAVEGAESISDEDFQGFPMDELSKLSTSIMKFSGIDTDKAGK